MNINLINLEHFNLMSFYKDVRGNANISSIKDQSIKLLHNFFTQLENSHARLDTEIKDAFGEIIGNKYDYR